MLWLQHGFSTSTVMWAEAGSHWLCSDIYISKIRLVWYTRAHYVKPYSSAVLIFSPAKGLDRMRGQINLNILFINDVNLAYIIWSLSPCMLQWYHSKETTPKTDIMQRWTQKTGYVFTLRYSKRDQYYKKRSFKSLTVILVLILLIFQHICKIKILLITLKINIS